MTNEPDECYGCDSLINGPIYWYDNEKYCLSCHPKLKPVQRRELEPIEKDLRELRSEQSAMRQEIRDLRKQVQGLEAEEQEDGQPMTTELRYGNVYRSTYGPPSEITVKSILSDGAVIVDIVYVAKGKDPKFGVKIEAASWSEQMDRMEFIRIDPSCNMKEGG